MWTSPSYIMPVVSTFGWYYSRGCLPPALTARADVKSVASIGVAAEQQTLNDLTDIGALVWGHFVFQAQVAPAVPVIEEDAC